MQLRCAGSKQRSDSFPLFFQYQQESPPVLTCFRTRLFSFPFKADTQAKALKSWLLPNPVLLVAKVVVMVSIPHTIIQNADSLIIF